MSYGAIYPYTWWGNRQDLGFGTSYPFLLNRYGGAAAAYSLRSLSSDNLNVVRVRRDSDNEERDFKATEVSDGTLQSWVNGELDALPLDTATAAAAYSLRNLKTSYSGSVVRVRRSSDNAEANFTAAEVSDGTLLSWVGTSGTDNGFVTTWYDQAGSNNATQGTAASQPKIVDAGSLITENGKAAVSFDGVDDYLLNGITTNYNEYSEIAVAKNLSSATFTTLIAHSNGSLITQGYLGTRTYNWGNFDSSERLFGLSTGNLDLITRFKDNLNSIDNYVNNVLGITYTSTQPTTPALLGSISQPTILGAFEGFASEIIFYPSDQSTNRTKIENNISTYYDIYDTSANGYVATWYDQSVNGNDATQATASAQPQIVSNGVIVTENGKATLEFNSKFLALNSFYADDFFFAVVGRDNSTTDGGFISGGDSVDNRFDFGARTSSDTRILVTEASVLGRIETNANYTEGLHLFVAHNTTLAIDGNIINTGLIETDILAYTNDFRIGQRYFGSSQSMQGNIQEIIVYNIDQSDNRTDIENEINNYYTIYAGSPISGLLYDYPSSAAAYSVRQLTIYDNDYKETLVKVRRSSDNAEVDVKADTNYEISLNSFTSAEMSLGDWIGSDDGYVVTWYDQSGNSNDATQATASAQPLIVDSGVLVTENGKAAIDFDGVDDELSDMSFSIDSTSYSAYMIANTTGSNNRALFRNRNLGGYGSFEGAAFFELATNDQLTNTFFDDGEGNAVGIANGVFISDAQHLITTQYTSSTAQLYIDAVNTGIGDRVEAGSVPLNSVSLPYLNIGGAMYSRAWESVIQEIILYPSDQSTNRTDIESNINSHYTIYAGSPISGLLYDYPSSAAAYSVRQLTIYDNAYKETLVKVRRSSDNAEVDVKSDTNYEISLNSLTSDNISLGDWIGSDDGYVTTWYDQSGNDNDAVQATASSQPQLISGGVVNLENGKAAVSFDGSDDNLLSSNFTNAENITIHSVFNQNTSGYKLLWSHNYGTATTNTGRFIAPKVANALSDWLSGDLLFGGDEKGQCV